MSYRMSREEWSNMRPGDVLRFYRPDGTYVKRTVLPGKEYLERREKYHAHSFPIRRRSWTGRLYTATSLDCHPCGAVLDSHLAHPCLMTDPELFWLVEIGFNVRESLEKEVTGICGHFRDLDGITIRQKINFTLHRANELGLI